MAAHRVEALLGELDLGESEALIVALELGADLLLIDERTGRDVARRMGIRRVGLVGILIEAKNRGLIASVAEDLDRLVAQTTFRIHPTVRTDLDWQHRGCAGTLYTVLAYYRSGGVVL